MRTVFITGASGYIGGDILSALVTKYPHLDYRVLVRSQESRELIRKTYPAVSIVPGGLDDEEVLIQESSRADIIIHTADSADHLPAAQAIAKGAIEGHTAEKPAYWLHTSGAGILSFHDSEAKVYGEQGSKIYDDIKDVQEILTFPDLAFHRTIDKAVLQASSENSSVLKTAVVSPTTVYGRGRGPCSQRSRQVYEMAKFVLERRKIPIIGRGRAIGSNIHISSVTSLFSLLFEAALQHRNDAIWGPEAYYLVEEGEHCWGDVARSIGRIALETGLLPSPPDDQILDHDFALELADFEATSWGYNMRARASRARLQLGWEPWAPSLEDELPQIVGEEYQRLQLR